MRVNVIDESENGGIDEVSLLKIAEYALDAEEVPAEAELSIVLVNPRRMSELNRYYLDREGPTDVLSFPMDADASMDGAYLLGDVVLCPAVIAERAVIYDVEPGRELDLVLLHGILHLAGYEDETPEGNEEMDAIARRLLEETR
jgi:probable rRNA maturation factor